MRLEAITDYELIVPKSDFVIDDKDLPPSGDFSIPKMREASKKSHIVGDVVKEYCRHAFGKRAICFATDVETAGEIAEKFKAIGIPAACGIVRKLLVTFAKDMVERFRDGRLWILVNVDLFGEGFDVPACEVVIVWPARQRHSPSIYNNNAGGHSEYFMANFMD